MGKREYSKIIATMSMVLFVITLILGFTFMFYTLYKGDTTVYDVTIFVTSITITGGVYATTVRAYYNKSGLQNCIQIKKGFYKDAMDIRLEYDKQILELSQKYNIDQSQIENIEMNAPFQQISNAALEEITGKLSEVESTTSTDIDE